MQPQNDVTIPTIEAVRFWHLRALGRSPAHLASMLTEPDEPTASMELGTATHALILGDKPVTFYPGKVRNGKEWEAWRDSQTAGTIILNRTDYARASRMADSFFNCRDAVGLLSGADREKTILWDHDGRRCRSTPDMVKPMAVADLKTCQTSEPRAFMRHSQRMHYHAQLAWYAAAVRASGLPEPVPYIIAIESSAPYPVVVLRLTDRAIELGTRLWRQWWELLRVCEQSKSWPAYTQAIVDLDVYEDPELDFSGLEQVA